MKPSLPFCAIALLASVHCTVLAHAENCPADTPARRIVVTIGIDHYEHTDRWPLLHTAVNDADSLERVLTTKFGYQTYESLTKSRPLRNEKANREAIDYLVKDGLQEVLCTGDDLIIFFSGHGESRIYQDGDIKNANGYLIPFDARERGFTGLVEVKGFLEDISHLPARHILVILDACHSGIAIQDALQGMKESGDYKAALAARDSLNK